MRYALCAMRFLLFVMEEYGMAESSGKTSQIHVRVPLRIQEGSEDIPRPGGDNRTGMALGVD